MSKTLALVSIAKGAAAVTAAAGLVLGAGEGTPAPAAAAAGLLGDASSAAGAALSEWNTGTRGKSPGDSDTRGAAAAAAAVAVAAAGDAADGAAADFAGDCGGSDFASSTTSTKGFCAPAFESNAAAGARDMDADGEEGGLWAPAGGEAGDDEAATEPSTCDQDCPAVSLNKLSTTFLVLIWCELCTTNHHTT